MQTWKRAFSWAIFAASGATAFGQVPSEPLPPPSLTGLPAGPTAPAPLVITPAVEPAPTIRPATSVPAPAPTESGLVPLSPPTTPIPTPSPISKSSTSGSVAIVPVSGQPALSV